MKKRGFTLIEMLIVVAVVVTLMSMVFRLSSIGGDSAARNNTISRLQRLENCLSGYYAAFGTYPPVALHGTRDINMEVSDHDIQTSKMKTVQWGKDSTTQYAAWRQVEAACRAQPVDIAFPFPASSQDMVDRVLETLKEKATSSEEAYAAFQQKGIKEKLTGTFIDISRSGTISGKFNRYTDNTDWRDLQLFKFGLLSYLLPRYIVMMNAEDDDIFDDFAQWTANNSQPSDPMDGKRYSSWSKMKKDYITNDSGSVQQRETDLRLHVASIPSQAICARWMPNLEKTCHADHNWELYGVNITYDSNGNVSENNPYIRVYTPGPADQDSGYNNQYVLDSITVKDGWGTELFYYSPAPYQSYVLWSAGPNGRTFPPWISRDSGEFGNVAKEIIGEWILDDIVNMSN